jgi:hypothetical protein
MFLNRLSQVRHGTQRIHSVPAIGSGNTGGLIRIAQQEKPAQQQRANETEIVDDGHSAHPRLVRLESRLVGAAFCKVCLFDDLNDAMSSRVDQYGSIVDDRVAILRRPVLPGNLVIGHAAVRKLGSDAHFILIAIGRMLAFDDVAVEARPRVLGNAARRGAGSSADRSPYRTADNAADDCASNRAARGSALGHRHGRHRKRRRQKRPCDQCPFQVGLLFFRVKKPNFQRKRWFRNLLVFPEKKKRAVSTSHRRTLKCRSSCRIIPVTGNQPIPERLTSIVNDVEQM